MSLGAVKYDNILNPKEAWEEFKKYLIELYYEDYGEEFKDLITKRIDGTYYLFDSNPVDTYNFYKKNKLSYGFLRMCRIEREYSNYLAVKDKIDKRLTAKYKEILSGFYNTLPQYLSDDFLVVDYEAFSFESMRKLHSENTSEDNKNSILRRQSNYINFCNLYGVKPITDINLIDRMTRIKKELENEEFKLLIEDTIWGKRIRKDIFERTGNMIPSEILGSIIYDRNSCASVSQIPLAGGKYARLCYFPVMKNYSVGSLDKIFFHENRHVVESDGVISGFTTAGTRDYFLINELRTQENAIRDAYEFRRVPLFSNYGDSPNYVNVYEKLFAYSGPFIKNYLFLLNRLGINNAYSDLEYLFGRENLMALESHLLEADASLLAGFSDKIDMGKQLMLTYNLDRHYASRLR